jgi:cell division control protein 6
VYHLNKSSVTTGEIYDVYNKICSELGAGLLTQRRLGTLINELDVMGLLNAKVVSMGRYGRTKKIRLEIPRTLVKEVFGSDDRIGRLISCKPVSLFNNTN